MKPDTTRIDQQIEKAKARLSALYAKRREIIAASKPHRPQATQVRRKQLVELAQSGADMQTIVAKTQLSESTIRYYLWLAIADELWKPGEEESYVEREFELKKRVYPGIKWRKGGGYRTGSTLDRLLHPPPLSLAQMEYVFPNDPECIGPCCLWRPATIPRRLTETPPASWEWQT